MKEDAGNVRKHGGTRLLQQPEEENPLVSLHTANDALSVLPAIRKTAGKPRRIAFTRFAARRCAPLPWNTALAILACHMPEPASSGLWQVFYLPGWKTREACSAVRAMSLHLSLIHI